MILNWVPNKIINQKRVDELMNKISSKVNIPTILQPRNPDEEL